MKRSYPCKILAAHDGDTITVELSLGFGITKRDKIRFYGPDTDAEMGFNAPELNTSAGKDAAKFLKTMLEQAGWVGRLETVIRGGRDKQEKFGRYLGVLFLTIDNKEYNVSEELVKHNQGNLREYGLMYDGSGDVIEQFDADPAICDYVTCLAPLPAKGLRS